MVRRKGKKLKQDKAHKEHRAKTRKWRAQHAGHVYKKLGGKWQWVPKSSSRSWKSK